MPCVFHGTVRLPFCQECGSNNDKIFREKKFIETFKILSSLNKIKG